MILFCRILLLLSEMNEEDFHNGIFDGDDEKADGFGHFLAQAEPRDRRISSIKSKDMRP